MRTYPGENSKRVVSFGDAGESHLAFRLRLGVKLESWRLRQHLQNPTHANAVIVMAEKLFFFFWLNAVCDVPPYCNQNNYALLTHCSAVPDTLSRPKQCVERMAPAKHHYPMNHPVPRQSLFISSSTLALNRLHHRSEGHDSTVGVRGYAVLRWGIRSLLTAAVRNARDTDQRVRERWTHPEAAPQRQVT